MGKRKRSEQDIPIYVINLESRADRWRLQEFQARLFGREYTRYLALGPDRGEARFPAARISGGAKGLWATFEQLCLQLADDEVEVALILEDDAVLYPGFFRRVDVIRSNISNDVSLVQLGFLGDSSWRPNNSFLQNVKKLLRPRSRLRSLREISRKRSQSEETDHSRVIVHGEFKAGTHALLVYPRRLADYLSDLLPEGSGGLPLDRAFVQEAKRNPEQYVRARRSLAGQLPVRSDIPWHREK